ncbi:MAG: capsule assembly Wzi family protein [Gammaproteobacteria bacterium]
MIRAGCLLGLAAGLMLSCTALADPWAPPGDMILRHDVQLLADAGVIRSPVTAWPISWATLDADIAETDPSQINRLSGSEQAAFQRLRDRVRANKALSGIQPNAEMSVRNNNFWLRTFEDTPREKTEMRAGASWMGNRLAVRVQGSYVGDPENPDNQNWRMDGSYAAVSLGNQILSAGAIDRWWGPSWDNTLIYSNAARPIGGFALERNVAKAFETKWLSWIGPWNYSLFWGFLGDDRAVDNARLMAFRVGFRPWQSLEIGLTRSAIWCGSGRPCDADAVWDIIVANDNTGEGDITAGNDPSNQLAAIDFRWSSPWGDGPWAIYSQWVANDETNNLPSQWFGQAGFEWWGELKTRWISGSYTAHFEVSDTLAEFWESDPAYDLAYNHGTYQSGYRYKGKPIGAAADGDSLVVSAGLSLVESADRSWNALVRWSKLNKDSDGTGFNAIHAAARDETDTWGVQLSHRRGLRVKALNLGWISAGVGFQHSDNQVSGDKDDDFQGFLQWTWDPQGVW